MSNTKATLRKRRHEKTRKRIISNKIQKPRLLVFKSTTHTYAQLIDDSTGTTIASSSDMKSKEKATKTEKAFAVGKEIAKLAQEKKIEAVAFDRNGYKYHGRVKALADGAREGGLKF